MNMTDTGVSFRVAATEGEKKGKHWYTDKARKNEVQPAQWQELYDVASGMNTVARTALLGDFDIGWQTLQRRCGEAPVARARNVAASSAPDTSRALSARTRDDVLKGLREHLEVLREDVAKTEKRIERLEAMDDEEYEEMRSLMFG